MANRQALRQLQTRLAEQLQQAQAEGVVAGWLAVELTGDNYLLPLAQSGEIFSLAPIQKVPYTHTWFLGVSNLRGYLCGIVDLASFIQADLQSTGAQRPLHNRAGEHARLVTLNSAIEVNCAFLIDRLNGLRRATDFVSREAPPAGSPSFLSAQYRDTTGITWTELDLQQLVSSPDFLSIAAASA
jgi:twitching motility protein PilI